MNTDIYNPAKLEGTYTDWRFKDWVDMQNSKGHMMSLVKIIKQDSYLYMPDEYSDYEIEGNEFLCEQVSNPHILTYRNDELNLEFTIQTCKPSDADFIPNVKTGKRDRFSKWGFKFFMTDEQKADKKYVRQCKDLATSYAKILSGRSTYHKGYDTTGYLPYTWIRFDLKSERKGE